MASIMNLAQALEVLEHCGYRVHGNDDALMVSLGGSTNPFTAVLTIGRRQLDISCRIADLSEVPESKLASCLAGCLAANQVVKPYAFAILATGADGETGEAQQWTLILTDALPLGDLSDDELAKSMESLLRALQTSGEMLRVLLAQDQVAA